jgi:hypothetical protein
MVFMKVDVSIKADTFLFLVPVLVLFEVTEECCCVMRTCLSMSLCVTYCQCLNSLLDLIKLVLSYLQNSPWKVTEILHVKT